MNVSSLWLAELYEQLVESIFITKEIALESPSSSLNSSSTMNFMTIMDSDWLSPFPISTHTLNRRVLGQELAWLAESHNWLAESLYVQHYSDDFRQAQGIQDPDLAS